MYENQPGYLTRDPRFRNFRFRLPWHERPHALGLPMNHYLRVIYLLLVWLLPAPGVPAHSFAPSKSNSLSQALGDSCLSLAKAQREKGDIQLAQVTLRRAIDIASSQGDLLQAANAYRELGNTYAATELNSKIKCFKQALVRYQKIGNREQEATTLEALAQMHHHQGNHTLAIDELMRTLVLYRSIPNSSLHRTYALLSGVYKTLGNYPEALRYGLATLENALHTQDTTRLSFYHLHLGYLYNDLNQPEEALKSCEKALQHVQKARQDTDVFNALSLAVNVLLKEQRAKEALLYMERITKDNPPRSLGSAGMLALFKTQCHMALRQYSLAKKHIVLAEQYLMEMNASKNFVFTDDSYRMGVYQVAGELFMATQDYGKARYYFNKMVQVNEQVNYLNEAVLHQFLLFKLDSAQGNFKEALRHYQHYKLLSDSIFNETKSKQIANLQIEHETRAKGQRIDLLTKQSDLQQAMLKQKDFQQTIAIIGSLLLLLLLVLVYGLYQMKRKSNKLLEGKQAEINQKNESLRQLLAEKESLLANKDVLLEEKEWLLKEIHHRVKNNLQIVMSLLHSQAAYLEDEKAVSAILDSQHRVQAMSLIHQKLYQSEKIATIAMEGYISELVENLGDSYSMQGRVRFHLEITPVDLDVAVAVPLGLLINEAVTNCLKYAFPAGGAGVVHLSFIPVDPSSFLLTIADNGIGLANASDPSRSRSLGMKLMKGLSKQLGGSLTLENSDGLKIMVLFNRSILTHSYAIQAKST